MAWIYVSEEQELQEGNMVSVYPLGVNTVLSRVNGTVYAVAGKCLHMACPLFMGTLDSYILTCPCHDWRFDIRDGRFLDAPELSLKTYPTKTENGKIYIDFN